MHCFACDAESPTYTIRTYIFTQHSITTHSLSPPSGQVRRLVDAMSHSQILRALSGFGAEGRVSNEHRIAALAEVLAGASTEPRGHQGRV